MVECWEFFEECRIEAERTSPGSPAGGPASEAQDESQRGGSRGQAWASPDVEELPYDEMEPNEDWLETAMELMR
jgi:hypothetical protein